MCVCEVWKHSASGISFRYSHCASFTSVTACPIEVAFSEARNKSSVGFCSKKHWKETTILACRALAVFKKQCSKWDKLTITLRQLLLSDICASEDNFSCFCADFFDVRSAPFLSVHVCYPSCIASRFFSHVGLVVTLWRSAARG